MNIPPIWPPIYVNSLNRRLTGWYVDGGLYNNLPISYLRKTKSSDEKIIGFYLDKKEKYIEPFLPLNIGIVSKSLFGSVLDRTTFDYVDELDSLALTTSDKNIVLKTYDFEPELELSDSENFVEAFEKTKLHKTNYNKTINFLTSIL